MKTRTKSIALAIISGLILMLILMLATQHQQPVNGAPIGNGHSLGIMRDPMPWEDGYFDPSYHAWPKSGQQQVGDKQSGHKEPT